MADVTTSPLHEIHHQAEAEFQAWGDIEVVSTFGEPQAEYAAIRKSAGLMDLPQRGFLELSGRDRLPFLNNILTADLWDKRTREGLEPGRWVYSLLLNLRGRIVADMSVLELGDRTLLELDRRLVEPLAGLLDAYLFSEQVKIANRSDELHEIALFGPGAEQILGLVATDATPMRIGSCAVVHVVNQEGVLWRDDPTGSPGLHLIVPVDAARPLWMHLIAQFAQPGTEPGSRPLRPIGWAAFNTTRIEAGRPMLGIDIEPMPVATAMPSKQQRELAESSETGPGMLPAEIGLLERAVSLSKCYVGQEIVARMHARGQVARRIVGVKMEDDALPIAGAEILDDESNPVGVITSSTNSPLLSNIAICLGIAKRPKFEIGTNLKIPAEGQIHTGTVVQTPFITLS